MSPSFPYALAFDREAEVYDTSFNALAGTRALRARIWRELRSTFQPGSLVLDIGCGTGDDAGALADAGVSVVAIDVSPAMIARARAKHDTRLWLPSLGGSRPPVFSVCDAREVGDRLPQLLEGFRPDLPAEAMRRRKLHAKAEAGSHREPPALDGILSNFGALNCLASLEPIRQLADRHLRPGGVLVLVLMNRWYLRELARLELRRLRPNGSVVRCGGQEIPLFYHQPGALRWPGYSLERVMALASWSRSDVQTMWPLNRLGDHYLAVLEKLE